MRSDGSFGSGTVAVSGNVWTFTASGVGMGKPFQEKCSVTFGANNASLDVKCEASTDGKTWATVFEGKSTKGK